VLISFTIHVALILFAYHFSTENIPGVGELSTLTFVDYIGILITTYIAFSAIGKLFQQLKHVSNPKYAFAQIANAFNAAMLNQVLLVFILILLDAVLFNAGTIELVNEKPTDQVNFFLWLITIVIFINAFKHCPKELS